MKHIEKLDVAKNVAVSIGQLDISVGIGLVPQLDLTKTNEKFGKISSPTALEGKIGGLGSSENFSNLGSSKAYLRSGEQENVITFSNNYSPSNNKSIKNNVVTNANTDMIHD